MTDRMKFENRNEFPAFLNECGLVGSGAEIGVLDYDQNDGKLIGDFGVQKAVKEFAARDNWDVCVTESEMFPSWFTFKT